MGPFLVLTFLLLPSCGDGSLWKVPVGTSVFGGPSADEKKTDPVPPLISYGGLKNNLPAIDGYSYPLHEVPVGEKLMDTMVPKLGSGLPKVIDGKALLIYEDVTSIGKLDLSVVGGEDLELPEPGSVSLPFSEFNVSPMVTSPFPGLESVPSSPPFEFFLDEIQKRPEFFD